MRIFHMRANKRASFVLMLLCLCYGGAIFLRCGMSYEFLTSIIIFSLAPFLMAFLIGSSQFHPYTPFTTPLLISRALALKWGAILFTISVLAFVISYVYLAYLRGGGDIILGVKSIYQHDFLRRMIGGNPSNFHPAYAASLQASPLEVIKIYLSLHGLKTLLALSLFCVFIDVKRWRYALVLLIIFSLPALSWFILGKSHAFIHRHFCFVLWYLGFMAVLYYIPLALFYHRCYEIIRNIISYVESKRDMISDMAISRQ